MSVGIGSKSALAYAEETTYGVFPSALAGVGLGFNSESIQNTRNTFKSEEVTRTRNVTSIRSGNVSAGGDVTCDVSPNALGIFFKHLLTCAAVTTTPTPTALTNSLVVTRGTYYTSVGANVYLCTRSGTAAANATTVALASVDNSVEEKNGTAYFQYFASSATNLRKHVFTANTVKPTGGIAMEREAFLDTGSQFFRYVGGRVNSFGLNVPQEGIVTATLGMLFLDLDSTGTATGFTTRTFPNDEPFAGSQVIVRTKPVAGSYAEDFSLTTLSLNVNNNFDSNIYTVGLTRRRDLPEMRREVTASFGAVFEDMTKFNYFQNESTIAVEITMNYQGMFLKMELPYTKFTGGSPAPVISGNGVVNQSFEVSAYNPTGAAEIVVELYNTTTAY